jgi:hypothetical protein
VNIALKEWAAIVEALSQGLQIAILRKTEEIPIADATPVLREDAFELRRAALLDILGKGHLL